MTEGKIGVGRPTKYRPEFCEQVIELGKLGKSIEQIGGALDVGTRTLFAWRDEYEEFQHALERAKEYEMIWWEEQAQTYMLEHKDGPKLNTGLWSRSMAARFPKKYRESVKQEITGKNGAPLIPLSIPVTFVKPE